MRIICLLLAASLALWLQAAVEAGAEVDQPDIVILVADDLGYADVGFHGSDIQTPHLDRLAATGVRLERFYAAPVCSPTRAGLLTGRWPIRSGLQNGVVTPWRDRGLPPEEVTIAEVLGEAGYPHRAIIGKWHLGHADRKYLPREQGFTHFYGHYNGAIDYFTHEREGETDWHRNAETVDEPGYSTDLLAAEAVRFVEDVPDDQPYLLYVPFNAPHSPFQAKEEDLAKYPDRQGNRRAYAAMVDAMDQAIGRILEAVDARGNADNTLVLFFSDNGGVRNIGDNGDLRGHKGTLFEGGTRVVAAARWPAGGLQGGRECDERMGYIDILPTLRRVVGLDEDPPAPLDGIDVLDALRGDAELPDRPWYNFLTHHPPEQQWSVQTDEWKLVLAGEATTDASLPQNGRRLLFHIGEDPREQDNVADEHPRVVEEMMGRLTEFQSMAEGEPLPFWGEGRSDFEPPRDWVIDGSPTPEGR